MSKIILTRGIQGSGKSTWAKQWALEDPQFRIRFNNDDIRNMLGKYWVTSRESVVVAAKKAILEEAMHNDMDIVVDNMNLNDKEVDWFNNLINSWNEDHGNQYKIEFKDFFIPVDECIARDALRTNPIGKEVITNTWRKYRDKILLIETKKILEKRDSYKHQPDLDDAIICDLDGTVAFRSFNRPFYGEGCAEGIALDLVDYCVSNILTQHAADGIKILFVTGREETKEIKEATEKWIQDRLFLHKDEYELFMRPEKDYSKGIDCKLKIFNDFIKNKYNVRFVLEDSTAAVKMYRDLGLLVLQPNEGKF